MTLVGRWTSAVVTSLSIFILISQATLLPPLIMFNNRTVSVIDLPSADPPSRMLCESPRGNPPPQLHWEVDGTPYLGRVELVSIGPGLYTNRLSWDRGGGWHIFDNANDIVCRVEYPGLTNETTATVTFNRNYAPRTVKVLAEGFIDRDVAIRRGDSVHLGCISDGHPVPSTFAWELWSEEDQNWKLHNHNEQNISVTIDQLGKYRCKASNELNQHSPTTSINQITVSEQDGAMVLDVSDAMRCEVGMAGVIAMALGATQFITLVMFTLLVIILRRNLRRFRREMPSRRPMARSKAHVSTTTTTHGNTYVSGPESRGPSTSEDMGLYDSVRRANIDSSYYLEPIAVYEEIRDRSTQVKVEEDIALL